jgi:predicted phosphoribosyltransferase
VLVPVEIFKDRRDAPRQLFRRTYELHAPRLEYLIVLAAIIGGDHPTGGLADHLGFGLGVTLQTPLGWFQPFTFPKNVL